MKRSIAIALLALFAVPLVSFAQTAEGPTVSTCVKLTHLPLTIGSYDQTTGGEVSLLQEFLMEQKFLSISSSSGYYGFKTAAAVKSYQASKGITQTGSVGTLTSGAIASDTGCSGATTPSSNTSSSQGHTTTGEGASSQSGSTDSGTYSVYTDGNLVFSMRVSQSVALTSCASIKKYLTTSTVRCTWNGSDITNGQPVTYPGSTSTPPTVSSTYPRVTNLSPSPVLSGGTVTLTGTFALSGNTIYMDYTRDGYRWYELASNLNSDGTMLTFTLPANYPCPTYKSGGVGCPAPQSLSGNHTISVKNAYGVSYGFPITIAAPTEPQTPATTTVSTGPIHSGTSDNWLELAASTCQIQLNQSTCKINATWKTTGKDTPAIVVQTRQGDLLPTSADLLSIPAASSAPLPINVGRYTRVILANNVTPTSQEALADAVVHGDCAPGLVWDKTLLKCVDGSGYPDLITSDIAPSYLRIGSDDPLYATTTNIGSGAVTSSFMNIIWMMDSKGNKTTFRLTSGIKGLAAGASTSTMNSRFGRYLSEDSFTPGIYKFQACSDAFDQVVETNETNNCSAWVEIPVCGFGTGDPASCPKPTRSIFGVTFPGPAIPVAPTSNTAIGTTPTSPSPSPSPSPASSPSPSPSPTPTPAPTTSPTPTPSSTAWNGVYNLTASAQFPNTPGVSDTASGVSGTGGLLSVVFTATLPPTGNADSWRVDYGDGYSDYKTGSCDGASSCTYTWNHTYQNMSSARSATITNTQVFTAKLQHNTYANGVSTLGSVLTTSKPISVTVIPQVYLSASPSSGTGPLTVNFSVLAPGSSYGPYTLMFSGGNANNCATGEGCASAPACTPDSSGICSTGSTVTHIYKWQNMYSDCTKADTWQARLVGSGGDILGKADITVQPPANACSGTVLGASTMCVDLPLNIHRGYESPLVSELQNFLIQKGLLDEATGFYGDKTVKAVKAYQASKGLPQTGMVFDFTRSAIKADSCQ